jgi:hypothetical protein
MSLEASFGPFAAIFEAGGPGYLSLLRVREPGAQIVIDGIAKALSCGESAQWVAALLQEANWRPHLVGAVALLLEPSLDCQLLWQAVDRGSWVTPQLVVTATLVDPTFREQARSRVATLCPVVVPVGLTPLQRHSATGPAGEQGRSAKMLASLIAASVEFPDLAPWRAEVVEDEHIKSLLAKDASWDNSDKIVASWSAAIRKAFLVRGRELTVIAE